MAKLMRDDRLIGWPAELETYDPGRWPDGGRAEWHLARAHVAPNSRVCLEEIQMASRRPWLDRGDDDDLDEGGVVVVVPPVSGKRQDGGLSDDTDPAVIVALC